MDKYWITFSQWHKSSAAAGFEAACGVVRHFKKILRGPLWGHGKQGHTACPQKDQPAWGHFLFSRLILQHSTSAEPRGHKWNPSLSLSVSLTSLLLHPNFLAGFICSHLYIIPSIANRLPRVVSTVSGSSDHRYLASQSTASYHCSLLALQAGRGQGASVFLCICKQKRTTVYSPIHW